MAEERTYVDNSEEVFNLLVAGQEHLKTNQFHYRTRNSLRFLDSSCCNNPDARRHALNIICKTFDSWLDGYGSPPEGHLLQVGGHFSGDLTLLVTEQLPDILRLSTECPFQDVRERCENILQDLEVRI